MHHPKQTIYALSLIILITLSAQAWAAIVEVSWDAADAPDVLGYKVHYGTKPGSYDNLLDAGSSTSVQVGGLEPGKTYYFTVNATYATGESVLCNESSIAVPSGTQNNQTSQTDQPSPNQNTNTTEGASSSGGGGCFISVACG